MKLIIDITEEQFKDCQRTLATPFELSPLIERHCAMIINGKPLEDELKEIRADILSEYPYAESDKARLIGYGIHTALEYIDKRIAELKGE